MFLERSEHSFDDRLFHIEDFAGRFSDARRHYHAGNVIYSSGHVYAPTRVCVEQKTDLTGTNNA